MAVLYTPHFIQFFANDGTPLSGGKLWTYSAGTTTPKATYTTAAGTIENANPVVLDAYGRAVVFISGAYRFDLYTSADVLIKSTDNVTSFNASTASNEGFFNSFSGDGATVAFTLTENLGTDEKALFVFAETEYSTNGTFASDTGWTKGAGWTISAGVATATGAISTALEQSAGVTLIQGKAYSVKYTITRSAGTITLSVGGTAGTARSADGTYSETIIAGSTQTISFGTSGFTGTVDNVSIRDVTGPIIKNPNTYTVDGTALTFATAPASGSNNIYVFAPYTLIGAAGAAQVAADEAIAAQAAAEIAQAAAEAAQTAAEAAQTAAETAETNAETAETNAETAATNASNYAAAYAGTSTTSLAIGTGAKVFTTQASKLWVAGQFLQIASNANAANYMNGTVTSYSGTTLTMNITNVGGSGTLADWNISISGTRGADGPSGGVNNIDFSLITTQNTIDALADSILFNDASAGNVVRKAIVEKLLDSVNTLTAESTVSLANDKFLMYDASAGSSRSITGTNLATALGVTSGGGWVPIKTVTASGSSTVDFVNGSGGVVLDGTYKAYAVVITSLVPASDGEILALRTSTNAGSSYDSGASDYNYANITIGSDSATVSGDVDAANNYIYLGGAGGGIGNAATEHANAVVYLYNPAGTRYFTVEWSMSYLNPSTALKNARGSGSRLASADVDAIRFLMTAGNITSGTFTLYGLEGA